VCFRHLSSNEDNRQLLVDINASGKLFLSHTVLRGKYVLRFAIGNHQTNEQDVRQSWQMIQQCAAKLAAVQT
jgi:hypothetical protein